jgi:hypothetical protein
MDAKIRSRFWNIDAQVLQAREASHDVSKHIQKVLMVDADLFGDKNIVVWSKNRKKFEILARLVVSASLWQILGTPNIHFFCIFCITWTRVAAYSRKTSKLKSVIKPMEARPFVCHNLIELSTRKWSHKPDFFSLLRTRGAIVLFFKFG